MNNKRSSTSRSQNTRKTKPAPSGAKAEQRNSKAAQRTVKSPVGLLRVSASADGLCEVLFVDRPGPAIKGPAAAERILASTTAALNRYFKGDIKALKKVPLALCGTPFQQQVWNALARIPAGKTVSYGSIARSIRRPAAVRAVGTACGKNHICLFIPCHRVVAANNGLGGFSGGLDIKRKLLKHEGSLSRLS